MSRPILILLIFSLYTNLFSQEIYPKRKGSSYVFVDNTGKQVLKEKYQEASNFHEGLAAVLIDKNWGYINKGGKLVIPPKYASASNFRNEIAYVKEGNAHYLIDLKGVPISEKYDSIYPMRGYYILNQDNLFGIADSTGKVIEDPKFSKIAAFYQDQFTVKLEDKWGNWEDGKLNFNNPELYFNRPERLPVFSEECEKMVDLSERQRCSDRKMLETIYNKLKYPEEAKNKGIEGIIVIEFIIDKAGRVLNPRVIKDIGAGCGEEGLKVVKEIGNWYKAGEQDGELVNTLFYLPIKFKLE